MSAKTLHLLHLAALALLFYLFALAARVLGATLAAGIFLPLAVLFECRFWWKLFKPDADSDSAGSGSG